MRLRIIAAAAEADVFQAQFVLISPLARTTTRPHECGGTGPTILGRSNWAHCAIRIAVVGLLFGGGWASLCWGRPGGTRGMTMPSEDDDLDFLRRQVLTSRNVRGGRLVDLALGGLNYQIEHHLFPSMPRSNLRRASRWCVRSAPSVGGALPGARCWAPTGRHCVTCMRSAGPDRRTRGPGRRTSRR
jgi:fatty acid desaturase